MATGDDVRQGENYRRLLKMKQVCSLRSCSPATLYREIAAGRMPVPIKFGRMSRWDASEVEAAIERAPRGLTDMSSVVTARQKARA